MSERVNAMIIQPAVPSESELEVLQTVNGFITFSDNQVHVGKANHSAVSQFLCSLDDVGYMNNQSDFQGRGNPPQTNILMNTVILSNSLRAMGNRFNERLGDKEILPISLVTAGLVGNMTAWNQGDHCTVSISMVEDRIENEGNAVIADPSKCETLLKLFRTAWDLLGKPIVERLVGGSST